MNRDTITGNGRQLTGSVKEQGGNLTVIEGKRDQERRGVARGDAGAQVDRWENQP